MIANVDDPVEAGFVESLARPGGNVTGVVGARRELDAKRLQLLVEAVPSATRVAFLGAQAEPDSRLVEAAAALGVVLLHLPVTEVNGYAPAIEHAVAEGADALLFQQSGVLGGSGDSIGLATQYRLPTMHPTLNWPSRGGLMAYAVPTSEIYWRAAEYVDRILRGTRPADLPVELATRAELKVNLRTARAIGLTLSRNFLVRADEVIE